MSGVWFLVVWCPQAAAYEEMASETWTSTAAVLHDDQDWRLDKGTDLNTGTVHSKQYKGVGRVAKLQVRNDAPLVWVLKRTF